LGQVPNVIFSSRVVPQKSIGIERDRTSERRFDHGGSLRRKEGGRERWELSLIQITDLPRGAGLMFANGSETINVSSSVLYNRAGRGMMQPNWGISFACTDRKKMKRARKKKKKQETMHQNTDKEQGYTRRGGKKITEF